MQKTIKRVFDFTVAFIALIVCLPLLIFISILVYFKLGSPIFFRQTRSGLNRNPFTLIKFRTMKVVSNGVLESDAARLTTFGKALRSTSCDELPSLLNVLKGDMSLVGPRPLLTEYNDLYDSTQVRRHEVKPGVTGWAQVNGRNSITWEDKFMLDVWYVDNQSFVLDIKILFMTVKKVFFREGINAEGQVTVEKFKGSQR